MMTTTHRIRSAFERRDAGVERKFATFALQIKATGDDGLVEGYGSVFDVQDDWQDVISKGAFAASLKAHKEAGTTPGSRSASGLR
jgi:phage head maturation protease